ncbi:hypothetical protein [Micromonospora profundi]|uniref:hypothetical protein n=1 Tax=Micromonospora profundi TaxID=1420889 RepID=UPI0036CFB3E1
MTPRDADVPDKADAALDALIGTAQDEVLLAISAQSSEQADYLDARLDARLHAANDEILELLRRLDNSGVVGPVAAARVTPSR